MKVITLTIQYTSKQMSINETMNMRRYRQWPDRLNPYQVIKNECIKSYKSLPTCSDLQNRENFLAG